MEDEKQYLFTETYSDAVFSNAQMTMREKINNYINYGEATSNEGLQKIRDKRTAMGIDNPFTPMYVKSISISTIFAEGMYRITVALICCAKPGEYENHGQTAVATQLLVS